VQLRTRCWSVPRTVVAAVILTFLPLGSLRQTAFAQSSSQLFAAAQDPNFTPLSITLGNGSFQNVAHAGVSVNATAGALTGGFHVNETPETVVSAAAGPGHTSNSNPTAFADKGDGTLPLSVFRAVVPTAPGPAPIHWHHYFAQEFFEVSFQMGERLATESKTRSELNGPYFKNWFYVVRHYRYSIWNDGDKFFTSNIGHPAQGAIVESIFWQNDDRVRFREQDLHDAQYWKALMQAALLCAVDAVQWKIGPLSEATIGHVGLPTPEQGYRNRTGMNDMVLNETGGTVMLVGFQWLDKHLQKPLEKKIGSGVAINTLRVFTNPPGSMANVFRFRAPWYRDDRK
jgi:hypothetical protein